MEDGFSFVEVLVSLFLMTTTSLWLLKQQWQVQQSFYHVQAQVISARGLDDACERIPDEGCRS